MSTPNEILNTDSQITLVLIKISDPPADRIAVLIGTETMSNHERWKELCAKAAAELDPQRLLELVQEINQILEQMERKEKGLSDTIQ